MRRPLTDTQIKGLKPKAKRYELSDPGSRGLYVRVEPSGLKSFWSVYRRAGKLARVRLGAYGEVSLAEARLAHAEIKVALSKGRDPALEKRQASALRRVPSLETGETIEGLAALYIRHRLPKLRTAKNLERILRKDVLPVLGALPVQAVNRPIINTWLDGLAERAPVAANKALSALSAMLTFAVRRGIIEHNPAIGIEPPGKSVPRSRVLTDDEISAVWHGTDHVFHRFAFRWLLATGCRKGELVGGTWGEVTKEAWVVPGARVKAATLPEHALPLSSLMRALLADLPRISAYLLPASRGTGPMHGSTLNVALHGVIRARELEPFTVHDLRRTARTRWSEMRVPYDIAESLLGHVIGNPIGRTYDRYHRFPEKASALERWGARLVDIAEGRQGRVVKM